MIRFFSYMTFYDICNGIDDACQCNQWPVHTLMTKRNYRHYSNHASIHSLHVQYNDLIDRLSILCIFTQIYASTRIYAISWPDANIYVFRSQHTHGNQHHLCSYWSHIKCSKQSFDYYACRVQNSHPCVQRVNCLV